MEQLLSIISGGLSGATLVWLSKKWISERLKQSIQYEYSEKLESYKTEINSKLETIKHENSISQLRTSLFFDHQRNAFAVIISKIAKLNEEWSKLYTHETGLFSPVPSTGLKELRNLIYEHQLFLDEECLMTLGLIDDTYSSSFPYDDGSGGPPHQNDSSQKLETVEYILPRIASIFRNKIGIKNESNHPEEVAILTAITLVNNYHFLEIDIPPKGKLSTRRSENAADKVMIGTANLNELHQLLFNFDKYLSKDGGWIHEDQLKVRRCLTMLTKHVTSKNPRN
jgi:hypothetical protein